MPTTEPRSATVFRREETYFVRGQLITDDFDVEAGVVSLPAHPDGDEDLGVAVRDALAGSTVRSGGISDDEVARLLKELLVSAKVRSYAEFARSTQAVAVEESAGVIRIIPMTNLGPRGGFEHREEDAVEVHSSDPARLGATVRECLDSEANWGRDK
jgi:hypothetical protein